MTQYTKITDFASKDALLTGNPAKIVKGVEIDDEFNAIATADATSVKGPIGVTVDNTVVRWDGTTGRAVQGSSVTISDADVVTASGFTGPHNGTVGATTPSTGAFTTLSASGVATVGDATTKGDLILNADSAANSGAIIRFRKSGADQGYIAHRSILDASGSNDLMIRAATGASVILAANGSNAAIATASSTGLAVTGALSATGSATFGSNATIGGSAGDIFYADATNTAIKAKSAGGGIYLQNSAGSTQAVLDTAGNLGLGVTPSAWRSVDRALQVRGTILENVNNTTASYGLNYYRDSGSVTRYINSDYAAQIVLNNGANGSIAFNTAPSGTAGNAITFTQAMMLDANGNLLVGNTTYSAAPAQGVNLVGGAIGYIPIGHANGTASGANYAAFCYNGVGIGTITQSGTTAVTYNTTSDHRLKENVRPANAGRFMDIEFVDFEWVDGRHDCGVIAHQLQSVYPDLVIGEKDATEVRTVEITPAVPEVKDEEGNVITQAVPAVTEEQTFPVYQQVNYIGLIGRMGTRIQQLQRTVDLMEARLAALESA